MREPKLREVDARGFRRRLEPVVYDVYAAAMRPPAEQLPGRYAVIARHTEYPGFRALVAERRRAVHGFGYGFHGSPGQWWHDVVRWALAEVGGPEHADTWMADCFEVAELHVHPDHQGRGLGRALLTALCEGRTERTVVLSTLDRPGSVARRLYRSVGMVDLLAGFRFPGGGPPYAVMGATLPLAAAPSTPSSS
ncbi:GNAT family N-acetyltransferase [Actinomadura craniellae]|uniref:GNAT family N-acetyltransferase n=1 Tax=Actinomadura craniellae TaxID=2231787 RepID=A0A365H262_9ACTN|nr:GNAT family N-acetyltransferase [Actinomadura craniellae]RAY13082.1 GNAT family N-acetyltransferase [Actinomadura craniellae]